MARLLGKRPPARHVETIATEDTVEQLSSEFRLSKEKVQSILRGVGINLEGSNPASEMGLYREVIACKVGDRSRFTHSDTSYEEVLDEQLRSFDEIYVDTAPIIQEDWFLHFVTDAEPILKRRKKKLIILEKTLEELHGLKDNQEKDKEVRVRSTIRPDLIRQLARRGLVRIGDTGSTGIADDHLVSLFSQIGATKSLLLVTQDRGLSERIVRLAHQLEQHPKQEVKKPWFLRLLGRKKSDAEQYAHQMVACKLIEEGKLKRCYICPECNESYYDDLHACEGMVLCGRCYLDLKEQEAKQIAANQKKREAELKAEEERQKKLEEEERMLEREKLKQTVGQRVEMQKKRFIKRASLVLVVLLILAVVLIVLLL